MQIKWSSKGSISGEHANKIGKVVHKYDSAILYHNDVNEKRMRVSTKREKKMNALQGLVLFASSPSPWFIQVSLAETEVKTKKS